MEEICTFLDIPCVTIYGFKRLPSNDANKPTKCRHAWNAVYVADGWRFVLPKLDVARPDWGTDHGKWSLLQQSGLEYGVEEPTLYFVNEFYFMPDPADFVRIYYPDEEKWQLLDTYFSKWEFENSVLLEEKFFLLDMTFLHDSKTAGTLDTDLKVKRGEIDVCFGVPLEKLSPYTFDSFIYSTEETKIKNLTRPLKQYVKYKQGRDSVSFTLRFPFTGRFKFNVWGGMNVTSDEDSSKLTHMSSSCFTYIINCQKVNPNVKPYPDTPVIGWGPGPISDKFGIQPLSHDQAEVVCEGGQVCIKLGLEQACRFYQQLKSAEMEDGVLTNCSVLELKEDQALVYIRLPTEGEYALELFTQGLKHIGPAHNALNYLLKSNAAAMHFPNLLDGVLGEHQTTGGEYDVTNTSTNQSSWLDINDGKLQLQFAARDGVELAFELDTVDSEAAEHMETLVTRDGNTWNVSLILPDDVEYSLNVLARNEEDGLTVHGAYSYLINSSAALNRRYQGRDSRAGNRRTPLQVKTVNTSKTEARIILPCGYDLDHIVGYLHMRAGVISIDQGRLRVEIPPEKKPVMIAKLEEDGQYLLNLYLLDQETHTATNIARYQINKSKKFKQMEEDAKRRKLNMHMKRIRDDLAKTSGIEHVIELGDPIHEVIKQIQQLEETLNKAQEAGLSSNNSFVKQAKHRIQVLQSLAGLQTASFKREPVVLDEAITEATDATDATHELDFQIDQAYQLRDRLHRLSQLTRAVLDMEKVTVAEIRSYNNPPAGVHETMMAVLILCGYKSRDIGKWKQIQAMLGGQGHDNILTQMSELNSQTLPHKRVIKAAHKLSAFNWYEVVASSSGAGTFYLWAQGVINEVIANEEEKARLNEHSNE